MGDDNADAIEVFKHRLDGIFGMQIEVVRRFIHDDDVGSCEEHFRQSDLCPLSARKCRNGLVPFLILNKEASEHRANFLIFAVSFCEFIHDSCFWI